MSYNLELTEDAEESLYELFESRVPPASRGTAYDAVEEQLIQLADNPIRRFMSGPHGRPTAVLKFSDGDKVYYWGATLYFRQNERDLVVTSFFPLVNF